MDVHVKFGYYMTNYTRDFLAVEFAMDDERRKNEAVRAYNFKICLTNKKAHTLVGQFETRRLSPPELPSHIMFAITCSENAYARPCANSYVRQ